MDERICYFFSFLIEGIVFWNYVSILFVPKCSAKTVSFVYLSDFLFSFYLVYIIYSY